MSRIIASHVGGSGVPEPVVRKDRARAEVGPVEVHPLDREVPVWEGDGRVDCLQGLLEHEREGNVGRHKPRTSMPVVAALGTTCRKVESGQNARGL